MKSAFPFGQVSLQINVVNIVMNLTILNSFPWCEIVKIELLIDICERTWMIRISLRLMYCWMVGMVSWTSHREECLEMIRWTIWERNLETMEKTFHYKGQQMDSSQEGRHTLELTTNYKRPGVFDSNKFNYHLENLKWITPRDSFI